MLRTEQAAAQPCLNPPLAWDMGIMSSSMLMGSVAWHVMRFGLRIFTLESLWFVPFSYELAITECMTPLRLSYQDGHWSSLTCSHIR